MKDLMMEDELTGYTVKDSLGNEVGSVKDIIVDTTAEHWPVREVVVGTGILEKKTVCFEDVVAIDDQEKVLELRNDATLVSFDKKALTQKRLTLDEIKSRDVTCENDATIGGIYHFVVATGIPCWEVRNLLVKPKGDAFTGRRLRLDTKDVVEVKDTVRVRSTLQEVQDRCAEREP